MLRSRKATRGQRRAACILVLLLTLNLAACSSSGPAAHKPDASAALPQLAVRDQIEIYGLVARRLCGADDTSGGRVPEPVIYLVRVTDDAPGDASGPFGVPATLPAEVQDGIAAALADLSSEVKWVEGFDTVKRDSDTGAVSGGGVWKITSTTVEWMS